MERTIQKILKLIPKYTVNGILIRAFRENTLMRTPCGLCHIVYEELNAVEGNAFINYMKESGVLESIWDYAFPAGNVEMRVEWLNAQLKKFEKK